MTFWAIAYGLLILAGLGVVVGARHRHETREVTPARLYAERRAELEQDIEAGAIANAQAPTIEAELAQATLAEQDGLAKQGPVEGPRRAALILSAVLLPAIALPLYLHLGAPDFATASVAAHGDMRDMKPEQLIAHLESQLAKDPKNAELRFMLGRSYMAARRYDQAGAAFEQVLAAIGDQPTVLVEYADALAMQAGGRMAGKPAELVARALALAPDNLTALWLTGMAENEAGKRAEALQHLRRARQVAAKSEVPTEDLDAMIASLETNLGSAAPAPETEIPGPDKHASPAAGTAASLNVKVGISAELRAKLPADATLFVFAKATNGMPMPLAVVRLPVSALPASVTLDDSKAMAPQAALSKFDTVQIVARVSRSGQPIAASGDFEGSVASVATTSSAPVEVTIDRVVP